jgi:hypothetical protein
MQALGEHPQRWVCTHGHDGWHVQRLAQRGGSEWTDVGATADRRARSALMWTEAHVGCDLTWRLETVQRQAGQECACGGQSQTGNSDHDPQRCAEDGISSTQFGQFAIDVGDLGLNDCQHRCLQLGHQCLAGGVAGCVLSVTQT